MKLKDILELGTYGFTPDCKVEIFNMDNFEERLENEGLVLCQDLVHIKMRILSFFNLLIAHCLFVLLHTTFQNHSAT